jgi:hypothetical protein
MDGNLRIQKVRKKGTWYFLLSWSCHHIFYMPRKGREKPSGREEVIQAPAPPIVLAVFFAAAIAEIGRGE